VYERGLSGKIEPEESFNLLCLHNELINSSVETRRTQSFVIFHVNARSGSKLPSGLLNDSILDENATDDSGTREGHSDKWAIELLQSVFGLEFPRYSKNIKKQYFSRAN
jgi:hypothetical protein